jgi:hypothetical protein
LTKPLKGLEEVAEVEELSEEEELATKDPLSITNVTNRATLQENSHIRGYHGVKTTETIPILLRIFLTWSHIGKIAQEKVEPI